MVDQPINERISEIFTWHINVAVALAAVFVVIVGGEWRFTYYVTQKAYFDRLETVNSRLTLVDDRLATVDTRLDLVDQKLEIVDTRLSGVDNMLAEHLKRLDVVDQRLARIEARLDKLVE